MFGIEVCVASVLWAVEENKQFELKCSLLPKDEADKLRAERKARFELESQRRHELAVAREGRSLNFWGNR